MVAVERFFMPPQLGLCSLWLVLAALELEVKLTQSTSVSEAEKHLELGKQMLARGQFQDALDHFHRAIEGDPSNYLTYFRRATAFLALGKARAALPDLDQVISLKPDFVAARLQRGNVYLKQGRLDEAHIDFENVLRFDPGNEEANQHYADIEPIGIDIHNAEEAFSEGAYAEAVNILSRILERCPWSVKLREMRAESFLRMGDYMNAISDFKSTVRLTPDNTAGEFRVSKLHYEMGEADESLNAVRECLKLDPDHKECFDHYKKVKKLAKIVQEMEASFEAEHYEDCVAAARKVKKAEPSHQRFLTRAQDRLCYCTTKGSEPTEALKACSEAIRLEENPRFYCDRADAHLALDEFDEAIADFQRASQLDERYDRPREGVQRAQKLKKSAGKRNYYKILGVNKNTPKKDIVKAYRKLAQKWHPDNYTDEDEKKAAEKKFMDIAAAKEVLTDPEMRKKYDMGEDPLDPESQAGQQFNPFQHFHFHGQPFQFKFQYN